MTTRWLLPAASLEVAAAAAGVHLPTDLHVDVPEDVVPLAQAELVRFGAATEDGPHPLLLQGFSVLAGPTLAIQLTARTVPDRRPAGPSWQAWFLLAANDLLVLLRRGDSSLVEVAVGAGNDLRAELGRVVAAMPPTGRTFARIEPAVVPAAELSAPTTAEAARIVEQAQQSLQAVVTGRPREGSTPLGALLWYRLPDGWLSVEAAPDGTDARPVRIAPAHPADLPAALAPLVAGALA